MKNIVILSLLCITATSAFSQQNDEGAIKTIYDEALKNGQSYELLRYLTKNIGQRLSGSPGAALAVDWGRNTMTKWEFDSVWTQPVMVPHWIRGQKETAQALPSKNAKPVAMNVCAIGGSVGTGPGGIKGKIIEVKSFSELQQLGSKQVRGKIIFFNRPMDPTKVFTFFAYVDAVPQRALGASEAAKYGAIGVVVRSMTPNIDDFPHTGALIYKDSIAKIPAIAVSTSHAELLSKLIKEDKELQFQFETHCQTLDDAPSFNVVGQLNGGEYADQILLVGGHLDSWDLAEGAHDDGAGCVQAIEALRLLKAIGYQPRRTIRAVLFMNEENGTRGGNGYAALALRNKEKHLAAIESDAGGFTPRGLMLKGNDGAKKTIRSWKPLLEPYGLTDYSVEEGGADIDPLGPQGTMLIGYYPDSQRYFDIHHTSRDTFETVSQRELALGAASMAALIYLIDQHGL